MPGRERCAALEAATWTGLSPLRFWFYAAARKCGLYCYLGGVFFFIA